MLTHGIGGRFGIPCFDRVDDPDMLGMGQPDILLAIDVEARNMQMEAKVLIALQRDAVCRSRHDGLVEAAIRLREGAVAPILS